MKEILRYTQDKIRPYHLPRPSDSVSDGLILFLVGPTAVGKTEVSLRLARLINAEIISCDSMQVYRGMDIGTQKPTPLQQKSIPHHMTDIISPTCNFSVAEFRRRALNYIKKIHQKRKIPLLVGGTALYMKALVDGLFPSPPADRTLRAKLLRQEELNGKGFLYKQLLKVDPRTARKLHPNDTRRMVRALEVYAKTNTPMSELKKKTRGLTDRYRVKIFALNRNRQDLYRRIEARVDRMFKQGFTKECRRLIDPSPRPSPLKGRGSKRKSLSMTARQALGYKEAFAYLNGEISLGQAKELIKKNTRHFAKRQLSWFRNDNRVIWIDTDGKRPTEIAEAICKRCMK